MIDNDNFKGARVSAPDEKRDFKGNVITILPEGTLLQGRYEVTYLTSGGMGVIYKATDRNTDLSCIIKEILFQDDEEIVKMKSFIREKEMLSKFYHPGIVNLLDFFQEKNASYLVLEYVDGEPLDDFIRTHKPDINRVLYWSLQLCDVLHYLHNMSPPVIYRDLKPENIMLDKKDRIKLIDFGIARTYKEEQEKDTEAVGSPGFASPEQYGRKQTDGRSDIYSLGAILHYLLTGLDPRDKEKPFIFEKISSYNEKVPAILEEIVLKALEINPEKRYTYVYSLKKELSALSEDYPYEAAISPEDITEGEVKIKKSPGYFAKTFSLALFDTIIMVLIFIFLIPAAVRAPDFMRGRATEGCGRLPGCVRNLQNLADALELYAVDNDGHYPPDLTYLKDSYIEYTPVCTYSEREYGYKTYILEEDWYKITEETFNRLGYNFPQEIENSIKPLAEIEFSKDEMITKLMVLGIDENYIEKILSCCTRPELYKLWCPLPESHLPSGSVPMEGAYPQYSPSEGITGAKYY